MQRIIKGRFLSIGELLEFLSHFPENYKVGPFDRGKSEAMAMKMRDRFLLSIGVMCAAFGAGILQSHPMLGLLEIIMAGIWVFVAVG